MYVLLLLKAFQGSTMWRFRLACVSSSIFIWYFVFSSKCYKQVQKVLNIFKLYKVKSYSNLKLIYYWIKIYFTNLVYVKHTVFIKSTVLSNNVLDLHSLIHSESLPVLQPPFMVSW
jgi:phosphoglycerol transferase MdoB-like AlkP superfamily enzyme